MAIVGKVVSSLGLGLTALVGYGVYLEWNVHRWDRRIDALCAANGGKDVAVRVYETAVAPETKEYFSGTGSQRSFAIPWRRPGAIIDERFPYVQEITVVDTLNGSDPVVVKYVERIVRVNDNKVLGERYSYQRTGGGIPSPDPLEIRNCPKRSAQNSLEIAVFSNHPYSAEGNRK